VVSGCEERNIMFIGEATVLQDYHFEKKSFKNLAVGKKNNPNYVGKRRVQESNIFKGGTS